MPRHGTPVTKLASRRWQVRYRDPAGVQRKETFANSRQARERLDEVRTQVRRRTYVAPSKGEQAFGDFAREWAAAQDWKPTSRQSWPDVYKRLAPHLERLPLVEVDALRLKALQTALLER
jgi:hypothetical protein